MCVRACSCTAVVQCRKSEVVDWLSYWVCCECCLQCYCWWFGCCVYGSAMWYVVYVRMWSLVSEQRTAAAAAAAAVLAAASFHPRHVTVE